LNYGKQLSENRWDKAHQILELAARYFNTREHVDLETELEVIGCQTTAVDGESCLYETGLDAEYDNTMEVEMMKVECLKLKPYLPCGRAPMSMEGP
jgi:hypothetical protein